MATNLGPDVSSVIDGQGYNYDKVVFQKGKPFLDSEINLSQELQEILTQKSTSHMPSGWLTFRPYYNSNSLSSSFYTQDPNGAKPEVALVNGWPINVANTGTPLDYVNLIDLSKDELRTGSRVDGVFLEVWRSLLSPGENDGINKPNAITKIGNINGIEMFNEDIGWAVGENSTILKTYDSGVTWTSQDVPVATTYNKVKFYDQNIVYAVGNNGYIIKSVNGGQTWNVIYNGINDNLNDMYLLDLTKICVVGDNGTVLISTDGNTFNLIRDISGVTANLNGVYFYDTFVGWSVGNNGTLIVTKDGGNSWTRYNITTAQTGILITNDLLSVGFYNYNDGIAVGTKGLILKTSDGGLTWANVSSTILDNGTYKSVNDLYVNEINTLNKVLVRKEFPINFTIAVYPDSSTYFSNITYRISPSNYPNQIVFDFTGTLDHQSYRQILNLYSYATAEALRDAINTIVSPYLSTDVTLDPSLRQKARVFLASINYVSGNPSNFQDTSGVLTATVPINLNFSIEDKAWVVGTNGIILRSDNSGYKWVVDNSSFGFDFYDVSFVSDSLGWICGDEGTIIKDSEPTFTIQDTDLLLSHKGRIFPEGNILSEATDYLDDNMINPQVGVETTKRVQIQYRICIVDGVDPFTYPESGLGANYIFSLGPNASVEDSGNYTYANMGDVNGDYGLWQASCRNTVDGLCWAIPMFFVTRRNSSPFNVNSNINGSTYYNLGAVRPDGLSYQNIVTEDIVDLRRKINIHSYSNLIEKNIDQLLMNNLRTSISNKDDHGSQYGSYLLAVDTYTGTNDIVKLVSGQVTSSASLVQQVINVPADPDPTQDELTFGPLQNALFHNDPAYYSALAVRQSQVVINNVTTTTDTIIENITGTFVGLGTNKVIFMIDSNYVPTGGTTNVVYKLTASYMDYSGIGIAHTPKNPLGVRYIGNSDSTSQFYRGIDKFEDNYIIEELTERVSGYPDYTLINSAAEIISATDPMVYEESGHLPESDQNYQESIINFRSQQFRGSLIEYHYFIQTTAAVSVIRIPKNINSYTVFMVKSISNAVTGSPYKVSNDFVDNQTIRDREIPTGQSSYDLTNLIIYLDDAYIIPANNIVEIVLEVTSAADDADRTDVGFTEDNLGETQASMRSSFVTNFNPTAKSVRGFYKSILCPYAPSQILQVNTSVSTLTIDLTTPDPSTPELLNALIMGISSFPTREKNNQMYLWYKSAEVGKDYYVALPIASVTGLGTTSVTITLDSRVFIQQGTVYVPMLVKMATLPNLIDTSTAYIYYKYVPYQTINNLPSELLLEVEKCSEFVYVSNLGTGSSNSIEPEPYEMPIEHIPVNDTSILSDNMFSNIDDLDFRNFTINTGFVKMPAIIARTIGDDITLSSPNNVGDNLGRAYYTKCSENITFEAEGLTISSPRKVFIPMLARVRSSLTSPFCRGELVLVIFSKVYKARTDNRTGYFTDKNTEYKTGFFETANTAIGLYRLTNKPLVRV